jgi:hypothetical protein
MRFPPCTAQAAEIACLPKIFVMMIQLTSKYVYPFSDYSFKKLFGRQASKKILIDFLNELEHLAIYNIELPKFRKTEDQLNSRLDTWLYVLNNLTSFADIPFFLGEDEIFEDFFMNAELANFHREQYMAYVASMIETWDQNAWRATVEEKKEEIALKDEELMRMNEEITLKNEEIIRKDKALEEAKQEIKLMVKTMARNGIDIQIIHECTGLDLDQIRSLIED